MTFHLDVGFLRCSLSIVVRLLSSSAFLLAFRADPLALTFETLVKVTHDDERPRQSEHCDGDREHSKNGQGLGRSPC